MLSEALTKPFINLLLAQKYQQVIHKIARKQTAGTVVSWEDAMQTANLKVMEALKIGKFRQGGAAEFQRWAIVVARYEIINLVRKERQRHCHSLDATIAGTDLFLVDTIADECNLWDTLIRIDLVIKAIEAIKTLDIRYPKRGYLQLWKGMVAGKKQTQLALDLAISQGEISKRWRELVRRMAMELGLV